MLKALQNFSIYQPGAKLPVGETSGQRVLALFHCTYPYQLSDYRHFQTQYTFNEFNQKLAADPLFEQSTYPKWVERLLRAKAGKRAGEILEGIEGDIFYGNATTRVADKPSGHAFLADKKHIVRQLDLFDPDIVVTFGTPARKGLAAVLKERCQTKSLHVINMAHTGGPISKAELIAAKEQLRRIAVENREAAASAVENREAAASAVSSKSFRIKRNPKSLGGVSIVNNTKLPNVKFGLSHSPLRLWA